MKRSALLLLVFVFTITLFTACSGGQAVSTGLGATTSIRSSVAPVSGKDGTAQADTTVAAITLDSNGVIVKLSIDSPQTKVVFNKNGTVTSGLSGPIQSKREKGETYDMREASKIGKEWYEQIDAFEAWAIGKTVDEFLGLKTKKVDDFHRNVPDIPELTASVTITVGDYMKAVEKAAANAKPANVSGAFTTGLGIVTRTSNSESAEADQDGRAQIDSTLAAVTFNSRGRIVACSIDCQQTAVTFNSKGEFTADLGAEIKTNNELGDDYGLKATTAIGKEWYEQAEAFANWTIGKTLEEVKMFRTKEVDGSHLSASAVPELASEVSIDTGDFIAAIEKAAANAK